MPKEMKIGALAGALKKRTQNSVDGQGRFHIWGSLEAASGFSRTRCGAEAPRRLKSAPHAESIWGECRVDAL